MHWEAIRVVQARTGDAWTDVGSVEEGDSQSVSEMEPTGFANVCIRNVRR